MAWYVERSCSTFRGVGEVSIRVLNQETSKVLARVKQGEEIVLTDRGVVVARIVPADPGPLIGLVTAGRVVPARLQGPSPRQTVSVRDGDEEAGALLARLRAEGRY
jgi:prevent-host-death family protein